MSHLVIDVGTSGVRAAIVRPDATLTAEHYRRMPAATPSPGLVEFDAAELANAAIELARRALAEGGPVESVGITNQRASAIVWDAKTGVPIGPGIGWQDLRTIGTCFELAAKGFRVAPNSSATKVAYLLDTFDAERARDLRFGTVDTWLAWVLTEGRAHATDPSNAGVTAMAKSTGSPPALVWDDAILDALRIPASMLPSIVDSSGVLEEASVLPGSPPLAALIGDQQGSLIGQGCVRPGQAKITFGTGGMLDAVVSSRDQPFGGRSENGCFPIVAHQLGTSITWGIEAVMLTAGTCVDWLRDDLALIESAAASAEIAAQCDDTGDVWFVPALLGLGTPKWDYGARGTLLGLTRGSGRPQIVRAVLEGIAHRGADLVDAAQADASTEFLALRIDGGMSANPVFVQALADATRRPVEVSSVREATALGAGLLAGLAMGTWRSLDEIGNTWKPEAVFEPRAGHDRRERWADARERSLQWIPELSALDF